MQRPGRSCSAPARAATRPRSAPPTSGSTVVLVERGETLGGVCLNVGCIPSKALLHVAEVIAEAEELAESGVAFGEPEIDLDELRGWKEAVVGRLTGGLDGLAKQRKVAGRARRRRVHRPERARRRRRRRRDGRRSSTASSPPARAPRCCPVLPDDPRVDGLHRRARARRRPGAAARDRRRHHRPRDGDGLRRARLQGHRRRAARPADPGRRPGPRQAAAQAHRRALRGDPPRHAASRPSSAADDGLRGHVRRRRPRRSTASSSRSAAGPTATTIGAEAAGVDGRRARLHRRRRRSMRTNVPPHLRDRRRRAASRCSPTRRRTRARSRPR